jgi:hypothetical protein
VDDDVAVEVLDETDLPGWADEDAQVSRASCPVVLFD